MAIRGSLKEASLPDVLQLLALGQKTGCLSIVDQSNIAHVYFDRGRISYASIVNRRDRLGDILVKNGKITQEQLDDAIQSQGRQRDKRLGEILIERGIIDEDQLNSALAYQRAWGHRLGAAFLDQAAGVADRVFGTYLVRQERHVGDDEGPVGRFDDRAYQGHQFVDGDRQRRFVAEDVVGGRVADEQHRDPCLVEDPRGERVVGGRATVVGPVHRARGLRAAAVADLPIERPHSQTGVAGALRRGSGGGNSGLQRRRGLRRTGEPGGGEKTGGGVKKGWGGEGGV